MRATVTSYHLALERIRRDGHLFDVGQISARALTQLHHAQRLGTITIRQDSWPIRGYGAEVGEQKTIFQLTTTHRPS